MKLLERPQLDVRCAGCSGSLKSDFFAVQGQPIHIGHLCDTREAARQAATGDITLSFCHGCGLVSNRLFDPAAMRYQPGYDASLIHSALFTSFLEKVAARLVSRFRLQGKTVLEIGCGSGYFLQLLLK